MPNGNAVANVSLATSDTWDKSTGSNRKNQWHRVVFSNRLAEIVEQYVKGTKLYVEGRLQTRSGAGWCETIQHGSCG